MLCVLSAFVVLFAPAVIVLVRRAPHNPSRCRSCGYDLTRNVSGRCPECGTVVLTTLASADPTLMTVPGHARRGLLRPGVGLLVLAGLMHGSFVVTHLGPILDPTSSPYGHENAFGDAGRRFAGWCLEWPALSTAGGVLAVVTASVRARDAHPAITKPALLVWSAAAALHAWLAVAYMWWFFD